ncbi:hypothetical protein [Nocardiopsis algeriensis]|uniref:Winged helix-turn helix protein n=1 Tax=Nocardiopsis algeriensis TaxID=1478215 RepID=A0A841IN40_9ACTN|nr:hypothetical protein [Nocardiopsis algeriensis]MBB6119472.1 hypothetical protein [Nocardiopsis algeriensis]
MADAQIDEVLSVTARAVNNWRRTWYQGGTDALMSKDPAPALRGTWAPTSACGCGNCCAGAPRTTVLPPMPGL